MLTIHRYASLSKSGEAGKLASKDLALVRPIEDHELRTAIEELDRSTAAIEKRTETLRAQQNAMDTLVKKHVSLLQSRSQANQNSVRKWDVEAVHLEKAVLIFSQAHTS